MVQALAEGYIVGNSIEVTPKDVQPGGTIHIRSTFRNDSWFPAYGVLQLILDGAVIFTWGDLLPAVLMGGEVYPWEEDYTLPSSISSGPHSLEARESGQATTTAITDFTVTPIAPPGERNVAFSSIPTNAQIYLSGGYVGNTPLTLPLQYAVYDVKALYDGQEISKNVSVTAGSGTLDVKFTFSQTPPFDFAQWIKDNQWYIAGGAVVLGVLLFAIKKPDTAKRAVSSAKNYAEQTYQKGKEMIK